MKKLKKLGIATFGILLSASGMNAGEYYSGKQPYGKEVIPACDQFYVEVFGGWALPPDLEWVGDDYATENGYNIGGAFGTYLNDRIDVEFEVFYSKFDYSDNPDSLSNLALMFNAFYNIPIGQKLVAYVGGGVGAMNVTYEWFGAGPYDNSEWQFGYQGIAGLRYPITQCVDVFTEYRYSVAEGRATVDDAEYKSSDVSIGVRFKF